MASAEAEARRWHEEAKFFDAVAERGASQLSPIDPAVLQRYARPRRLDLLRVPGVESLGGIAVLWGHAPGRG